MNSRNRYRRILKACYFGHIVDLNEALKNIYHPISSHAFIECIAHSYNRNMVRILTLKCGFRYSNTNFIDYVVKNRFNETGIYYTSHQIMDKNLLFAQKLINNIQTMTVKLCLQRHEIILPEDFFQWL